MKISAPFLIASQLALACPPALGADFDPPAALSIRGFTAGALPTVSPGGTLIAYGVTDPGIDGNVAAYWPSGTLHVVRTDGTRAPGWPAGIRGSHATWSADGMRLAFVRLHGETSRLAWWDVEAGDLHDIGPEFATLSPTTPGHRFAPLWSANGESLIAAIPEQSPALPYEPVTVLRNSDPFLPGDEAFIDAQSWRVIRLDIAGGQIETLLPGKRLRKLELSGNGAYWRARTVVSGNEGQFAGDDFVQELGEWVAPVTGREPLRQLDIDGAQGWSELAPDGKSLFYLHGNGLRQHGLDGLGDDKLRCGNIPEGATEPSLAPDAESLAFLIGTPAAPLRGSPWVIPPAAANDLILMDLGSCAMTVLRARNLGESYSSLTWSADGSSLFFRGQDLANLRDRLYRAREPAFAAEKIRETDEKLRALSPSADGTTLVFLAEHALQPEEAWVWEQEKPEILRLTGLNPQLATFSFVAPEIVDFETTGGESRRALLYVPPDATARSPAPVVVFIYSWLSPSKNRFQAHAQMHAARGYAFLMPDVGVAIGDLRQPYVDSVIPALEKARADKRLSPAAGIYGGSLGGYGGLILLADSNRFSAGVLRAPPAEFATSWATGKDRDAELLEFLMGGSPLEVASRYRRHSPFDFADRIKAPLLLLHGRKDEQVPLAQGVMMFQALRRLGGTTEMVIYDNADHSIVRGSRRYYLDYYTRTLDWWDTHLGEQAP